MLVLIILLAALNFAQATTYDHYRLPTSIRPERYNLRVLTHLNDPNNFRFEGEVKIGVRIVEATSNITLHAKDLAIEVPKISLRHSSSDSAECISSTETIAKYNYFVIRLCTKLTENQTFDLTIPFAAKFTQKISGYFLNSYKDGSTNATKWFSMTTFEPADARTAFPCFDEPNLKAKFTVILGHHERFTSLSNMPLKERRPNSYLKDYVWSEFEESVPMSTYLVAYSVNDFVSLTSPKSKENNILLRTWTRKSVVGMSKFAVEYVPKVLIYLEDLFGIKFPLPKIDQIALTDATAAMENWGLIAYPEDIFLHSPTMSSFFDLLEITSYISHEVAHQWFGNLVTMDWWTDLWLNEGFATYVAKLAVGHAYPNYSSVDSDYLKLPQSVFWTDAFVNTHPISRIVEDVANAEDSFDDISYKKGATVLGMLHKFLGHEVFFGGVSDYLKRYSYKNAKQDDLWEALSQAAHNAKVLPTKYDVKTIMETWILQSGYPLLRVTRDYEVRKAKVSQERFLLNSNARRNHTVPCWWIPLSYTNEIELDFNDTRPKHWLECSSSNSVKDSALSIENMPGADKWIIFNIKVSAFYKVNYDSHNWDLLIEALKSSQFGGINVINRAQIVGDLLDLAWSGDQNYDTAVRLMKYLRYEREYDVWSSALDNLGLVYSIVKHTPGREQFETFLGMLLEPIFQYVGPLNDDNRLLEKTKSGVALKVLITNWVCSIGKCVQAAREAFSKWRRVAHLTQHNPIPVDLRHIVFCTTMRHGEESDWNFLWNYFKKSNSANEQAMLVGALGCTRNLTQLQLISQKSFNFIEVGVLRAARAFGAVASNVKGLPIALEFFKLHFGVIAQADSWYFESCLLALTTNIVMRKDYEMLRNIVEQNKKLISERKDLIQHSWEKIELNLQWKDQRYTEMLKAIEEH